MCGERDRIRTPLCKPPHVAAVICMQCHPRARLRACRSYRSNNCCYCPKIGLQSYMTRRLCFIQFVHHTPRTFVTQFSLVIIWGFFVIFSWIRLLWSLSKRREWIA